MEIIADYHTHTTYSHGSGTIEDNVQVAISKGLKTIGIADHGYKHLTYGIKFKDIQKIRNEIDRLNDKYKEIEILMGIEANILDDDGNIDVSDDVRSYFDYIMAGYHFGSMPTNIVKGTLNHLSNYLMPFRKSAIEYNTKAVINAMIKNDIFIITHPGAKALIDIQKVAQIAIKSDTKLEINSKHGHLTVDELNLIKESGVKFALGSDAHCPNDVANFDEGLKRINLAQIDINSIINVK